MTDTSAPQAPREVVHGWTRVSEHAYTRPLEGWKANVGVVVGKQRALLVDTGAGPEQAQRLLGMVRNLTDLPLVVVNTHAHFDHVYGNAFFADPEAGGAQEIWGHEAAAAWIREHGESQRTEVADLEPQFASAEGPHAQILAPTRTIGSAPQDLDLGGVTATLFHLGRGHTDGDLLVGVDNVVFAGDLVEQGAGRAQPGGGDDGPPLAEPGGDQGRRGSADQRSQAHQGDGGGGHGQSHAQGDRRGGDGRSDGSQPHGVDDRGRVDLEGVSEGSVPEGVSE